MAKVKVKNVSNGVESEFEKEHWENVKNSDRWGGVFEEVKPATPSEIKSLEATESGQKSTQVDKTTQSAANDKKAAQTQNNK